MTDYFQNYKRSVSLYKVCDSYIDMYVTIHKYLEHIFNSGEELKKYKYIDNCLNAYILYGFTDDVPLIEATDDYFSRIDAIYINVEEIMKKLQSLDTTTTDVDMIEKKAFMNCIPIYLKLYKNIDIKYRFIKDGSHFLNDYREYPKKVMI